jgi:hypothetical protein
MLPVAGYRSGFIVSANNGAHRKKKKKKRKPAAPTGQAGIAENLYYGRRESILRYISVYCVP